MQRPNEEILSAIVSLDGDVRWDKVRLWIKESHYSAIKDLPMNPNFHGGRVAELFDMMNKIETAKKELDALRKK